MSSITDKRDLIVKTLEEAERRSFEHNHRTVSGFGQLMQDARRLILALETLVELSQADTSRIDWLESKMYSAETYVEVTLAGLRKEPDQPAHAYWIALRDEKWIQGEGQEGGTLREAIDKARTFL